MSPVGGGHTSICAFISKLVAKDLNAMKKSILTLFLLAVLLSSNRCRPDPEREPDFQFEKGFGRSQEHPLGKPFTWPAGVRFVEKPTTNDDCFYDSVNKRRIFGHGSIQIYLNLYNEIQAPITVTLPPGFMFVSKSLEVQNMLLINTVTILVPPQEYFFSTPTMICVNTDRETPCHDEIEDQAIITDHPALRELVQRIKNKKCNYEDCGGASTEPNAIRVSELINSAVHDLIYLW